MAGFMERWREANRRTRKANIKEIDKARFERGRPLEGAGSAERLQSVRGGLAEVSQRPPAGEVSPLVMGAVVFFTIVIGGLVWPYIAAALR